MRCPSTSCDRKSCGENILSCIDIRIIHVPTSDTPEDRLALAIPFVRMPKLLSSGERQRKRRLQRRLARQRKGSNRRARTKCRIAKLAVKESDRRKDWIEKTTTQLVRDYDLIVVEDLKVKNMTKSASGTKDKPGKNVRAKSGLNRSILEQSWGMFRQRLTDKAINATVLECLI